MESCPCGYACEFSAGLNQGQDSGAAFRSMAKSVNDADGVASAAGIQREIEDQQPGDHLAEGDVLLKQDNYQSWTLIYRKPDFLNEYQKDTFSSQTYTVGEYFGESKWIIVEKDLAASALYLEFRPFGTDLSSLRVGDVLHAGDVVHHLDNKTWELKYKYCEDYFTSKHQDQIIHGNYAIEVLNGNIREWKVTSISSNPIDNITTILIESPRQVDSNAYDLRPGSLLNAGDAVYTPYYDLADPWYLVYQDEVTVSEGALDFAIRKARDEAERNGSSDNGIALRVNVAAADGTINYGFSLLSMEEFL